MHELPVAQNVLDIALKHANQADAGRVTDIFLVIGQLSSVIDDSIQFFWDIISEGTIAQGATLHFRRIEAEIKCKDCGHCYRPDGRDFHCPECLSRSIEIVAGDEFLMEAIDVE